MVQRIVVVIVLIILVACGQPPTAASVEASTATIPLPQTLTTYQSLILPAPLGGRLAGIPMQLPPAWLIIGQQAVAATYGSAEVQISPAQTVTAPYGSASVQTSLAGIIADAAPPNQLEDVATLTLTTPDQPVLVFGHGAIIEVHTRIAEWPMQRNGTAPYAPAGQEIAMERLPGPVTAFHLALPDITNDRILLVQSKFTDSSASGDVSYIWRLKSLRGIVATPAPAADWNDPADPHVTTNPIVKELLARLQQHGINIGLIGASQVADLDRSAPGAMYRVNQNDRLAVHLYASVDAAAQQAKTIPRTVEGEWSTPPHFFRCGALLAVYTGWDKAITALLAQLCGQQFAGDFIDGVK